MKSVGNHPLSVLWLWLAIRNATGNSEQAKLLAVCAAKCRQADLREQAKPRENAKKGKKKGKKARTVQNARVSGEVVRVAGYDLELRSSGNRESRGELVAQRGPVTGALHEFESAWAAVDRATDGGVKYVLHAITTLNGDEPAHDRFWESGAFTRALEATQDGKHRVFPDALIKLGYATNAA